MQPIILFAIVGVAAAALSMGALSNTFPLVLQELGVSEETLSSPVTRTVMVDLELLKAHTFDTDGSAILANIIDECSFHSVEAVPKGSFIICKLTDDDSDVIAEGKIGPLSRTLAGSTITFIPITNLAFPLANDVQNVHDVKIVILGPKPSAFTPAPPTGD